MGNDTHTLEQLQSHAARPAAEPRANVKDFNALMRAAAPTPAKLPPAEGGAGANAAQAFQDAISGRAPQFIGLSNTQDAARQWQGQAFNDPADADVRERVAAGKAAVAAAKAKFEAGVK